MGIEIYALVIAVVLFAAGGVFLYNCIVVRKNAVQQAYSTIDVMLQKRADLAPNLTALVEKSMQHEEETLSAISRCRAEAANTLASLDSRLAADARMQSLIEKLVVQAEKYPVLKEEAGRRLLSSLNSIEEQIVASRTSYNSAVSHYNTYIESFPANVLARPFGFRKEIVVTAKFGKSAAPRIGQLFRQ